VPSEVAQATTLGARYIEIPDAGHMTIRCAGGPLDRDVSRTSARRR
jgi:hypothetical protein